MYLGDQITKFLNHVDRSAMVEVDSPALAAGCWMDAAAETADHGTARIPNVNDPLSWTDVADHDRDCPLPTVSMSRCSNLDCPATDQ